MWPFAYYSFIYLWRIPIKNRCQRHQTNRKKNTLFQFAVCDWNSIQFQSQFQFAKKKKEYRTACRICLLKTCFPDHLLCWNHSTIYLLRGIFRYVYSIYHRWKKSNKMVYDSVLFGNFKVNIWLGHYHSSCVFWDMFIPLDLSLSMCRSCSLDFWKILLISENHN